MKIGDIVVHFVYDECELTKQISEKVFEAVAFRESDEKIEIKSINEALAVLREKYILVGDEVFNSRFGIGTVTKVPREKTDKYEVRFHSYRKFKECTTGGFDAIKLVKRAIIPFDKNDVVYDKLQEKNGIVRKIINRGIYRSYMIEFDGVTQIINERTAAILLEKIPKDFFSPEGIII